MFHYPITSIATKKLFIPTLLEKRQIYLPSFFFFLKKMLKRDLKQGSTAQKHYTRFHQMIFSPE